jgi:hypothetical protein
MTATPALALASVQTELTPAEIQRINDWIDKGLLKHLPREHYENGDTFINREVLADLRQSVWVRLLPVIRLPNGINTRQAFGFGQSAARDYVRDRRKTVQYPVRKDGNNEVIEERYEDLIIDESGDRDNGDPVHTLDDVLLFGVRKLVGSYVDCLRQRLFTDVYIVFTR